MNYMPTTRLFLRMFGLYPNKRISKIGIPDTLYIMVVSTPLWFVNLTSYAYSKANIKTADIAVITDSMYTSFIFTMMCGNYIILTIRKFQVRNIIDFNDDIVSERKQIGKTWMYDDANTRSEHFIKRYTFWCFVGNMGVNCFPFLKPLFDYITGHYSFNSWYTPYKSYMWHNVTYTPAGMTATLIGQELGCVCAILLSSTYLSLYVSSCLYISALLKDVAESLKELSLLVPKLPKSEYKMEMCLISIVDLHSRSIYVRNDVAEMVSEYLFISICNCVAALCTLMFQLQVSASAMSIEIYQAFGIGSLMVLFLFLFSYFGEMVTTKSLAIADSAWDSLWYIYPTKLQKYSKLTIAHSHMEFHFSGLGLMYCTMASFSGLVKTAVSFFMLQRFNFISTFRTIFICLIQRILIISRCRSTLP